MELLLLTRGIQQPLWIQLPVTLQDGCHYGPISQDRKWRLRPTKLTQLGRNPTRALRERPRLSPPQPPHSWLHDILFLLVIRERSLRILGAWFSRIKGSGVMANNSQGGGVGPALVNFRGINVPTWLVSSYQLAKLRAGPRCPYLIFPSHATDIDNLKSTDNSDME